MRLTIAAAGLLGLAACTQPAQPDDRASPAAGATATIAATATPAVVATPAAKVGKGATVANWNAEDACSLLDKRTVGAALGTEIETAALTRNAPAANIGESPSTSSVCIFTLADGQRVEFGTVRKLGSDISAAEIANEREMAGDIAGAIEDVQGVGKSAFWVPNVSRLDVFLGGDRRFYLTMPAEMGAKDPKTIALGLATRIE